MTKKSKFADQIKGNLEQIEKEKAGFSYLNLPKGIELHSVDLPKNETSVKERFDIIPYIVTDEKHPDRNDDAGRALPGEIWWKRPFKLHSGLGASGRDKYVCLTSIGKRCPVCEDRKKLMDKGEDKKETDRLKPSSRGLYVIKMEDSEDFEILDISDWCFLKALKTDADDNDAWKFPSLEDGLMLSVRFNKEVFEKNPYPEAIRVNFLERKEQYDESILEDVPNLDKVLKILSYDELNKKYMDMDDTEIGEDFKKDEDEDEKLRRTKTVRKDEDDEIRSIRTKKSTREIPEKPSRKIKEDDEDEEIEEDKKLIKRSEKTSRKVRSEDEDEVETSTKPSHSTHKESPAKSIKSKGKCPHDFEFGEDWDKDKKCDSCDVWDACMDANNK